MNATWIRVEYALESLGDISATAYEAELTDALKARWPGALVDIARTGNNRYNGENADIEIPSEEIKSVSESVFAALCGK